MEARAKAIRVKHVEQNPVLCYPHQGHGRR